MQIRMLILGTVVASAMTQAGPANAGLFFTSGNDLYRACASASELEKALCRGYVLGVVDSWEVGRHMQGIKACVPGGLVASQAQDAVLKFLTDHPEARDLPAPLIAVAAIQTAFCPQ